VNLFAFLLAYLAAHHSPHPHLGHRRYRRCHHAPPVGLHGHIALQTQRRWDIGWAMDLQHGMWKQKRCLVSHWQVRACPIVQNWRLGSTYLLLCEFGPGPDHNVSIML
jgi:hypothetical protein